MSDVKLFRLTNGSAEELVGRPVKLEKKLQMQKNSLLIWLPLDPDDVTLEDGFCRDVRGVGHHGTGDLELTIRKLDDLEKAKPLIQRSFGAN